MSGTTETTRCPVCGQDVPTPEYVAHREGHEALGQVSE